MAEWQGALNDPNEDYAYHDLGRLVAPTEAENPPEWGTLIHPDELRHVLFVGNSLLITVNGEQLTNYQLKNWTDHTVRTFAEELKHDIYPVLRRSRPVRGRREIETYAHWYDYHLADHNRFNKPFYLQLRRRPVCNLHRWRIVAPHDGQELYDLTPHTLIDHKTSSLHAAIFYNGMFGGGPAAQPIAAWRLQNLRHAIVHEVDFTSGYDRAERVPHELKDQILKRMIVAVMSAFGDGIVGGLANSSVSVGVLHESIGTTMSATSAYFGARIHQIGKEIDEWMKTRAPAYRGISVRVL